MIPSAVRDALKTALNITGLRSYDTIPENIIPPAACRRICSIRLVIDGIDCGLIRWLMYCCMGDGAISAV